HCRPRVNIRRAYARCQSTSWISVIAANGAGARGWYIARCRWGVPLLSLRSSNPPQIGSDRYERGGAPDRIHSAVYRCPDLLERRPRAHRDGLPVLRVPLLGAGHGGREARRDEPVDAVPTDLDTDTQQNECGQAHHHARTCRTQFAEDSMSVAIAEVHPNGNEQYTNRVRQRR